MAPQLDRPRYPFDPPPPAPLLRPPDPWSLTVGVTLGVGLALLGTPVGSVWVGFGALLGLVSGAVLRHRWSAERGVVLGLAPAAAVLVIAGLWAGPNSHFEVWPLAAGAAACGLVAGSVIVTAFLVLSLPLAWWFFGAPIIAYTAGWLVGLNVRRIRILLQSRR